MRLTPHFRLSELTVTRVGLPNRPPADTVCRLRILCAAVLEPWRTRVGPLRVTSGYRSPAVNSATPGASPTSLHLSGEAADVVPIRVSREAAWLELVELVEAGALPVDEAIVYERSRHVHVAYTTSRVPRRRLLVRRSDGRYVDWTAYSLNRNLPPLGGP